MATLTTTPIINRVSTLLQDTTHVRWPVAELLTYISDGQREICFNKPNACAKTATLSLVAGTKQSIPTDGVAFIDVPRNMVGTKRAVRLVQRPLLDAQIPGWHSAAATAEVLHYTFDSQNPKVIYVYPPNDGTGSLEVVYAAAPPELTDGATLVLDDAWLPVLSNYTLYRCYSKDAEYAANGQLAAAYYTAFTNQLAGKTAAEPPIDLNRKP